MGVPIIPPPAIADDTGAVLVLLSAFSGEVEILMLGVDDAVAVADAAMAATATPSRPACRMPPMLTLVGVLTVDCGCCCCCSMEPRPVLGVAVPASAGGRAAACSWSIREAAPPAARLPASSFVSASSMPWRTGSASDVMVGDMGPICGCDGAAMGVPGVATPAAAAVS